MLVLLAESADTRNYTGERLPLRFVIESSDHSVSNHLPSSRRFSEFRAPGLPDHMSVAALDQGPCVNWASPVPSRLATTVGQIEFTCVTDQSFTSSCSPPRLAATQLLSVTECQNTLTETFTLLIRCNYRRTRSGFPA